MTLLIDNDEPEIVTSPLSRVAVIDGWLFDVKIYRLDRDEDWALEFAVPSYRTASAKSKPKPGGPKS